MNMIRRTILSTARIAKFATITSVVRHAHRLTTTPCLFSFSGVSSYEKMKQQSKEFYNKEVSSIVEIESLEDWKRFIELSEEPIVLDCYADWCKPCKTLTPILQQKAKDAKGWKLVKLNIDKFPQIANSLQVKEVPTVYLVAGGRGVDGFHGMPDQTVLNRFFGTLQKLLGYTNQSQEEAKKIDQARELIGREKFAEAEKILLQLDKPTLAGFLQPLCYMLLAECFLNLRKFTHFQERIKLLTTKYKAQLEANDENAQLFRNYISKLNGQYQKLTEDVESSNSTLQQKKKEAEANPASLDIKYELAEQYIKAQQLEEAAKTLIEIVKADKNWQDKKANKLILEVFKKLGMSSELTVKYRKIYQRLLY